MCEPVTIGLMVASTAATLYGQGEAADDQEDALVAQRQQQAKEIAAQTAEAQGERVKQARAERARLRVAAGEAGVSGQSFEAQLFDSFLNEDLDIGRLAKDGEFADLASQSRYRSGRASIDRPNYAAAGLQIATDTYAIKKGSE